MEAAAAAEAAAHALPVPTAEQASASHPTVTSEPHPTDVGFFASLPIAVEASMTELHVENLADEQPTTIEPSLADETVAAAPAEDPFLLSLFTAEDEPVHPEAIPIVQGGKVRGSRRVARTRRTPAAPKAPKVKITKLPRSARRAKPADRPRRGSTLLSMGAMLFAGALLVGTTVPANAFITFAEEPVTTTANSKLATDPEQSVVVAADASAAALARDEFTVTSYSEVLKEKYGARIYTFAPTTGAIRWPFPYATPISSGYGDRIAPCRGCSSHHNGVDFTPGSGTPIYAVADGVVKESEFGGSFGQHVYLDHVIDGKKVESIYGHMIAGSSPLVTGQSVKVGDFIGLVGSTGASTGAHLHLEIHLDGVIVDPFAWLQANAN